jgi:predicted Zn-dependent protease with MMP-like domain
VGKEVTQGLLYTTAMTREEFEKLVVEGYDLLPEWVRNKIDNVVLLVDDEPTRDVRMYHALSDNETLLGHYQGIPLTERGETYGGLVLPDTITIYREPILDAAEEETPPNAPDEVYLQHVRRIVAETVWHEYAHHFGMDEHEVRLREDIRDGKHEHPHT